MGTAKTTPMDIHAIKFAREAPPELGLNVRKSEENTGFAELRASIVSHGVIVPLVVKHHGGVAYAAGGNRRLRALRDIHGKKPYLVDTVNSDDFPGDAREIAMATNLGLPPHPVDRYEVIAMLVKEGMTPGDAQQRFGMTPRQYQQTMRLGMLSPMIRDKWRSGEITAETAQAFTLTDDPALQDKTYKAVAKDSHLGRVAAHNVRHRLLKQQQEVGKFVEFVGVDACVQHGIVVNEDLFGTSHTVSDVRKLQALVSSKLGEHCDRLIGEGWSWASTDEDLGDKRHYYGRVYASKPGRATPQEKARLDEISKILSANDDPELTPEEDALNDEHTAIEEAIKGRSFTVDQRKVSGCVVSVGQDGTLKVDYGRVKPEERKKAATQERKAQTSGTGSKKADEKPAVITNALAGRLSQALTAAAAAALRKEPRTAMAALVAAFASEDPAVAVKVSGGNSGENMAFADVFTAQAKSTIEQQAAMLAMVASQALRFQTNHGDNPPLADPSVEAICNLLNATEMNEQLRKNFDAEDYFASVSRAAIAEAVGEAMGADHAANVLKMDKQKAVAFAVANVPKTMWLPTWLRTRNYDGPPAKKAPPTPAKAAPKKGAKAKAKK